YVQSSSCCLRLLRPKVPRHNPPRALYWRLIGQVSEPITALAQLIEKTIDRRDLRRCIVDKVDLVPERVAAFQIRRIPAQMLARDAHAAFFTVKYVMLGEMLEDKLTDLGDAGRRKLLAIIEEVTDLAKDPRTALSRTPDHDRVRARVLQHVARHFR